MLNIRMTLIFWLPVQVDRRRVKLTCVLIEGRYGRLYKGCIQADAPHPDTQVSDTQSYNLCNVFISYN